MIDFSKYLVAGEGYVGEDDAINNNNREGDIDYSDHDWWMPLVDIIARPYVPSNNTDWCIPVQVNLRNYTGRAIRSKATATGTSEWNNEPQWMEQTTLQQQQPTAYQSAEKMIVDGEGVRAAVMTPSTGTGRRTRTSAKMPTTNDRGFFYLVKTPKAGSTTVSSVSAQIVRAVATKKWQQQERTTSPPHDDVTATNVSTTVLSTTQHGSNQDMTSKTSKKSTTSGHTASDVDQSVIMCQHDINHGHEYIKRRRPYFSWTVIREPSSRAMSMFFFQMVSRAGKDPLDGRILDYLRHQKNFQLEYVDYNKKNRRRKKRNRKKMMIRQEQAKNDVPYQNGIGQNANTPWHHRIEEETFMQYMQLDKSAIVQRIQRATQEIHHFIAVTERMDESLIVFSRLFGFIDEEKDLVVLSSKLSGGYDAGASDYGCTKIQKAFRSPIVQHYLDTDFRSHNYDFFLHAVANRSLDKTINMLGRASVEEGVRRLQWLRKLATDHCFNSTTSPCTTGMDGQSPNPHSKESCYYLDVGCGHACVEKFVAGL